MKPVARFWVISLTLAAMVVPWIGAAPIHFAAPIGRLKDEKNPWPGSLRMGVWNRATWVHETTALQRVDFADPTAVQAYKNEVVNGALWHSQEIERDGVDPKTATPKLLEEIASALGGLGISSR
jgi:hypothetical protein